MAIQVLQWGGFRIWTLKAKSKQDHHHHHHHHNNPQTILIIQSDDDQHENHYHPTAAITMILTSWLNRRRIRYLFLVLCSPVLLPFLCITFPLLCAAEICLFLCRRRQLKATPPEDSGEDGLPSCEEDGGDEGEGRLLQRYLEDQLILVVGSVYDYGCGDEDNGVLDGRDDGVHGDMGVEFFESIRTPLLQ
ncbi:unnamed protein product [Ilex paraguariensis]|uniref:Uncharacterized protein n=1 Tax=Ilex paraguariensis TaxID=185542 RepID=A0ABC8SDH4_9AQUA